MWSLGNSQGKSQKGHYFIDTGNWTAQGVNPSPIPIMARLKVQARVEGIWLLVSVLWLTMWLRERHLSFLGLKCLSRGYEIKLVVFISSHFSEAVCVGGGGCWWCMCANVHAYTLYTKSQIHWQSTFFWAQILSILLRMAGGKGCMCVHSGQFQDPLVRGSIHLDRSL